jgi:hypothetical protein
MIEISLFTPTDNAVSLCSLKLDFNLRSGHFADLLLNPAERHAKRIDRGLRLFSGNAIGPSPSFMLRLTTSF